VGALNSAHIFGTYVPVQEPSTASKGDIGPFHLAFSRRQITSSSVNGKRHRFSFEMG